MKRPALVVALALLGALLAVLPLGGASAATASGGGLTVSTPDVTLPGGTCGTATTTITGTMDGAPHWDVTLTVYDPHGAWVAAAQLDETSPTRTLRAQVCSSGRYRVDAAYTTYDSQLHATSLRDLTSTFLTSTRARSSSTLTAAAARTRSLTGTLTRAGKAWTGHRVELQVRKRGAWHTVARRTTDAAGRVAFRLTPATKHRKVRLYAAGDAHAVSAASRSLRPSRH